MKIYKIISINIHNEKLEDLYLAKNKNNLLEIVKKNKRKIYKILEEKEVKKIKEKEIKEIYIKIGRLLNAGISLKKAIEFQKNSCKNLYLKYKLSNLYNRVEKGEDIYEVLRDENLIKEQELLIIYVSETSGKIGDGFLKIAELKERKEKLKTELKVALSYPIFILFISTIILFLIFYFIVPNFKTLYSLNTNELPKITVIILSIEEIVSKYSFGILFLIIFIFLGLKKINLNKIIFFKKFMTDKYIINILDNLSILLESGISIDKGIEIILENVDNDYLKNRLYVLRNIKRGETLSNCLMKINLLLTEEIDMIKVGEESGNVELMLKEISETRERELNKKIKIIVKLAEPILLLIIGIMISIFVVGLYLPILDMDSIIDI